MRRYITSGDGIPQSPPGAPFSAGVLAGDLCVVGGQLAIDPATGRLRSGSVAEEARIALGNFLAVVRASGLAPEEVVLVTLILTDIDDLPEVNQVYLEMFSAPYPARLAFAASGLALGARVEVQGLAVRGDSG